MHRRFLRAKSIVVLLFVLSLLFAVQPESGVDRPVPFASQERNVAIGTGLLESPFLPVRETEAERLISTIRQQGWAVRSASGAEVAACVLMLFAFLFVLCFPGGFRTVQSEDTGQFHRSVIRYIQTQSDQE